MESPTPHDALARAIFGRPEHAAGELRHLLPSALSARVDWSTLRSENGSFIDETLRGTHSDLLFSVRCRGTPLLLYLLFEHQSVDEPRMALRLLAYMVRIWEQYVRENPAATRLPAIVPLVLHHSERGWASPAAFEELLALDAGTLPLLADYVPKFRFLLDDISGDDDEALRARAMSGLARLALFCLRHARESSQLIEALSRWSDLVDEVRAVPGGREALMLVWRYILVVSDAQNPENVVERLLLAVGEANKEEVVNVGDWLMDKGRQEGLSVGRKEGLEQGLEKGLEKGLERGLEQGRVDALRETLQKQLGARFGALPAPSVLRIRAANVEQLDQWLGRVLTAASLDEILGER